MELKNLKDNIPDFNGWILVYIPTSKYPFQVLKVENQVVWSQSGGVLKKATHWAELPSEPPGYKRINRKLIKKHQDEIKRLRSI